MRTTSIRNYLITLTIALTGCYTTSNAYASDDQYIQVEPSLTWMSNNIDTPNISTDNQEYQSFIGKSEIWSGKWGVSANLSQNQNSELFGLPQDSQFYNLDVKRRFGSKSKKSSIELGLGWQEFNVEQFNSSGPKLSLTGKMDLKNSLKLYGSTAWLPELDNNSSNTSLNRADSSAYELEAGVLYQPYPSISLKAGYRHFQLDSTSNVIEDLGSSSGFLFGTDYSW